MTADLAAFPLLRPLRHYISFMILLLPSDPFMSYFCANSRDGMKNGVVNRLNSLYGEQLSEKLDDLIFFLIFFFEN